ncbi:hypothetical protein V6N13_063181 [Hibiscus sabdariffa]|uniref:CUE domain-containing protein n=1 Tax=Hibiscus sabdariffa TaxID=183260 RepID=A0ABR2C4G3_9ROSI
MPAAVCGSKRSFFEDIPSPSASVSKKLRRCSPSSVRFAPPHPPLDHLQALFPHMDLELLERTLLECGNDIDTAIKRLQELHLGAAEAQGETISPVGELGATSEKGILTNNGEATAATVQIPLAPETLPVDGSEWVNLFVRQMMGASSVDDAQLRASKLLEVLEISISKHVAEEAAQSFHKENVMLKEQIQVLIQENTVLKRAVAIQHERQKEYQDKNIELEHLKQLMSQYQEQLRTLEVNNYALSMHLKQAQQSNSIPGRFHPDVF